MRAKRSLGQNFLIDDAVSHRIVDALELDPGETVVEIGPGVGALTEKLLAAGAHVTAIEFDRELIDPLEKRFGSDVRFKLRNEDALSADFSSLIPVSEKAKLVGNLPYNISTPILQRVIDDRVLFSKIVFMFQREVVERITARPGGKGRGFLSVLVEAAFETEYLFDVCPTAFRPVPKVWSAVVRLTPKTSDTDHYVLFRKLVSVSFAQKRKTILNNLKHLLNDAASVLSTAGIDPNRRAETLSIEEWKGLTEIVASSSGSIRGAGPTN
ncbi:MAG: 16S rRNA (adenine(1518)-N(6)/adenine(1519)-N(6))-dimethyltransferase RsmA [Pyrinomonadaceae bacterium]